MSRKIVEQNILKVLASKMLKGGYGQVAARRDFLNASKGGDIDFDIQFYDALSRSIDHLNVKIISEFDQTYPPKLKELKDHPFLIFVRGDVELFKISSLTIVGTRRSSLYGGRLVEETVTLLNEHCSKSHRKIGVISGMAYGIDRKAHSCSLAYELPSIAVVAGGLDKGFPMQNSSLVEEISRKGLLISEFPPGTSVIKGMFPMRNRLMAALGTATIVIEAPLKSGALLTAKQAIDLGRDVYAFPGDYFRESSKGSNALIVEGASPLSSKFDILDMINRIE